MTREVHASFMALYLIRGTDLDDLHLMSCDIRACDWTPMKSVDHPDQYYSPAASAELGGEPTKVITCPKCLVLKDLAWEMRTKPLPRFDNPSTLG